MYEKGETERGGSCQVVHLKYFNILEPYTHISLVHEAFLSFYISKAKSMMLSLSYLVAIPKMTFQRFFSRIFLIVIYIKFDLNKRFVG